MFRRAHITNSWSHGRSFSCAALHEAISVVDDFLTSWPALHLLKVLNRCFTHSRHGGTLSFFSKGRCLMSPDDYDGQLPTRV